MKVNNNLIKGKMKELGISPGEMAILLGCNTQNIYNLLAKNTVPIFTERLMLMCYILDISPLDVLEIGGGADGN